MENNQENKSNQEKWDEIIEQIESLGWDLDSIIEKDENDYPVEDDIASAMMGLRIAIDHLREQEIPD